MPPPSIEDLNLPTQAPHFTKDRGPPGEPAEFAIYHIADLTREACQELGDLINSDPSGCSASKLAPSPDFTNRSVRDVYDSFLTLREEDDTIQPFFFIVADRSEFEEGGVLGVCLDCSQEGEGDVGVVRCDAEWADSYGAQLVEGMVSWEELKEYEAARGDEYERVRSMGVEERHAHEAGKYGWEAGTSTVRVRDIYGWYSLVQNGERLVVKNCLCRSTDLVQLYLLTRCSTRCGLKSRPISADSRC